ncbi:hypothetical protein [Pseudomonas sp. BN102]|uniref:hypothetical protein n=1 Tax=Pseudomonas sp. BN102 TaxID=2567886 RepID=UPI002458DA3E|nr:hypothetical protein [Pseudomonas sp. BN102]
MGRQKFKGIEDRAYGKEVFILFCYKFDSKKAERSMLQWTTLDAFTKFILDALA